LASIEQRKPDLALPIPHHRYRMELPTVGWKAFATAKEYLHAEM